jgi:putative transcriptional regulator
VPRWAAVLAACLLFIAPAKAAELSGRLLVATPDLADPNFDHTVILIVQHGADGALGLVVNDQRDERPLAEIMAAVGLDPGAAKGKVRVFLGGPVQRDRVFVLHSAEYARPETLAVGRDLALTTSEGVFRDMADGKGPRKAIVVFGYAGWAPGQLEGEMTQGGWFTEPADAKLIFDESPQRMWDEALRRRPQAL